MKNILNLARSSWAFVLLPLLALHPAPVAAQLPELGDRVSGTVSQDAEHRLGRAWLRSLRGQTPVIHDPLLTDYLQYLVYRLAEHSELVDRRLETVIVRSPDLNAFAVPGGIIGVNGGLFIYARTEQEFASVIAHELAHLSQRHYSRNVEVARRNQIPSMAALLASIAIAAAAGGEAGMAALSATQAILVDQQLRFSRQNEQEADRIGIQTLSNAGMDPRAMASMFERMLAAQRLQGSRPPEFLLTHPVTESRVADARARASQVGHKEYNDSLEYYLMRTRVNMLFEQTPAQAIQRYQADLDHPDALLATAARYGLALAYHRTGRSEEANRSLQPLLDQAPNSITYWTTYAEINQRPETVDRVEVALRNQLKLSPNNYPLSFYLARTLSMRGAHQDAAAQLEQLSKTRPDDPNVWYHLAETYGQAGNIVGVHSARAEYFILTSQFDRALEQLGYAYEKSGSNYQLKAKLEQRQQDVRRYQEELKQFTG